VAYDAEWHNDLGNEGLFTFRSGNREIKAFCGAQAGSCWRIVDKVGDVIWMDDSELSGDLLFYDVERKPSKDETRLVITKIRAID
jgi:hypothetical protein